MTATLDWYGCSTFRLRATLVGSYEAIRVMEAAGVPAERMICVSRGETVDLGNDVRVTA